MTRYTFNVYYDPTPEKGNPFRTPKTQDQIAVALHEFPDVLGHILRSVDETATVTASPDIATNGRIPVIVSTILFEQQLYKFTKEQLNYFDLYGDPIRELV